MKITNMKKNVVLMLALCFGMQSVYGAEQDPKQNQKFKAAIAGCFMDDEQFNAVLARCVASDQFDDEPGHAFDSDYYPVEKIKRRIEHYPSHCVRVKDYQEWKTTKLNPEKEIIYGNFTAFQKDRNFGRVIDSISIVIFETQKIKKYYVGQSVDALTIGDPKERLETAFLQHKEAQEYFAKIKDAQNRNDAQDALALAASMIKEAEELVKGTSK